MKLGRNQVCYCGSGLKYKKCCLRNKDFTSTTSDSPATHIGNRRLAQRHPQQTLVKAPPGQIKMSGVILELAKELLEQSETKVQRQETIGITVVTYNISLLEPKQQQQEIQRVLSTMPFDQEDRENMSEVIQTILRKKHKLYPDLDRIIVDYEVVDTKYDFFVNIASIAKQNNHEFV